MDLSLNNERNSKRIRYFKIIFLGIFLTEIIIYSVGLFISPIRTDWLIGLVSAIFISGIYTVSYFLLVTYIFHIDYTKKFISISSIK